MSTEKEKNGDAIEVISSSEKITLSDVTLKCEVPECNWKTTGKLVIVDLCVPVLIETAEECLQHHNENRISSSNDQHNRFIILIKGKKNGWASISSAGTTCFIRSLMELVE